MDFRHSNFRTCSSSGIWYASPKPETPNSPHEESESVQMNIHEYQAKALLHEFGVPISRGAAVLRASDSDAAAKTLGRPVWVVKSQIHAGGRGQRKLKAASAGGMSGVLIAQSVAGVQQFA